MKVNKKIDDFRVWIMSRITRSIGSSHAKTLKEVPDDFDFKRVLIIRPNHKLGNQLLLTPVVQEVINTFPECKVDLFVKGGVAYPVFENYQEIDKIYKLPRKPFSNIFKYVANWILLKTRRYDLVINGDKNSSSGRLLTQLSRAPFKIFGDVNEDIQQHYSDYDHISKYPIYNLRWYLEMLGLEKNESPLPLLDIKLSESEIALGKSKLYDTVKNNKKTICIYTNATGNKCYSSSWWNTLYNALLRKYPDFNIIEILPIENISKIDFKAKTFYSKDIREMGALISNTAIFISADNGIMHLASASKTPTIGFFMTTDPKIYEPYGNKSSALNTNKTDLNDWLEAINNVLQ